MKEQKYIFILVCSILSLVVITGCTAPTPAVTQNPSSTATQVILPTVPAATTQPTPQVATQAPTAIPPTNQPPTAEPTQAVVGAEMAVILVPEGQKLTVHNEPNEASSVVTNLAPDTTGLTSTGERTAVGDINWVKVTTQDNISGWVNGYFLTEEVNQNEFCQDTRVSAILDSLGQALQAKDGDLLKSLVSPAHGLTIYEYHTGNAVNFSPEEAGWVFKSTFETNWGHHPASDEEIKGTFSNVVLPDLLDTFAKQPQRTCMQVTTGPINYTAALPDGYANIAHFSVYKPGTPGTDLDWRTWVVGFEYVQEKPYLLSLHQFFWEP